MGTKYTKEPLFRALDARVKKEVEFDEGLSQRVDAIVVAIQSEKDKLKKTQLFDKLIMHVHKLLLRGVNNFYIQQEKLVEKKGVTKEDLYNQAVELMMVCVTDKWKKPEVREAEGETPASFVNYFFYSPALYGGLHTKFVRPFLTDKGKAEIVSIDQPRLITDLESGEKKFIFPENFIDENATDPFLHTLKNQEINNVLDKLYTNDDPFLSLIVLLRLPSSREALVKWLRVFTQSDKNLIKKTKQKFIPKAESILEKYDEDGMTLEQVGEVLGISGQAIQQIEERALGILKKRLKLK